MTDGRTYRCAWCRHASFHIGDLRGQGESRACSDCDECAARDEAAEEETLPPDPGMPLD